MVYSNYDLVHNIEGITYNLENNKIVKTKLNKKNFLFQNLVKIEDQLLLPSPMLKKVRL
jgi:hypothetical protein